MSKKEELFVFDGYRFESAGACQEAKKEAESIAYIKAKTDLNQKEKLDKLYTKLVEKHTFITPVGVAFLKEIQEKIIALDPGAAKKLPGIPVHLISRPSADATKESMQQDKERKMKNITEYYKGKSKNARIMNFFFIIIILIMFGITLLRDGSPIYDMEMKIQNKYSAWAKELKEKEEALNKWENELKQNFTE